MDTYVVLNEELSNQLRVASNIVWIVLVIGVFLSLVMVYNLTGSFILSGILSVPVLIFGGITGILPLWIVLIASIPVTYLLFSSIVGTTRSLLETEETGEDTKMVNQLIQDPEKLPKSVSIKSSLYQDFEKLGFERGLRALKRLDTLNSDLVSLFARVSNIDESLVNISKMKTLTTSVYEKGLSLLGTTLEIAKTTGIENQFELAKECEELEEELPKYKDSKVSMYLILQERLDKNRHILELVKRNSDRLDETLANVGLCIDSLREISLELPELLVHKSKDDFNKVLLELKTRVEFAQRVKDEYDRRGI